MTIILAFCSLGVGCCDFLIVEDLELALRRQGKPRRDSGTVGRVNAVGESTPFKAKVVCFMVLIERRFFWYR